MQAVRKLRIKEKTSKGTLNVFVRGVIALRFHYNYILQLIGADFVSWCMLHTYEGNKMTFVRK